MEHLIPFLILGVLAGIISGALGVGSGLVMIPALVLLFNADQKSAQGIALAVMVPMAAVGAMRYIQHPDIKVDLTIVAIIAVGGVAGALLGSYLASILPAAVLRKLFAVFLLVVAARMLWSTGARKERPENGDVPAASLTEQPAPPGE